MIKKGKKIFMFLRLKYFGNQTIYHNPPISITRRCLPSNLINRSWPPEMICGIQSFNWPEEFMLDRGYALGSFYCRHIMPDRNVELIFNIKKWFRDNDPEKSMMESWGAIGGWAWRLGRAMDNLETDVDTTRVAIIGHSRIGKAVFWGDAEDERFAMAISNESGLSGAKLSRRIFIETVANINSSYTNWFFDNFKQYNNREEDLLVDRHELRSLIAPRHVYISSVQRDMHTNPIREFLSVKHASSEEA